MATLTASDTLKASHRLVIKIGSALLVDGTTGALRESWLNGLISDVAELKKNGCDVLIVSSGSIALGRGVLNLPNGPLALEQSQAAAAVGQIRLARAYETALAPHGITAAQVLVTLEDSENRRRYLNSRATLATLLDLDVIPIVNENDTVATDEIRYGDNDRLAAQVAVLAGADALLLLSDIDGLYTMDPRDPDAIHIPHIASITPEIEDMAGGSANENAKGGMKTKVWAARTATDAGCAVIVAKGDVENPLTVIKNGTQASVFEAKNTPSAARKQWINAMKSKGKITVDTGAAKALNAGNSLLPAGVTHVEGRFERGDPVDIVDADGHHVARALTNYDCHEARALVGAQTADIPKILGHDGRAALIHRDDMAL